MKTETSTTYRVSERVVLEPGDLFRAKGGPFWKNSDGTKTSLKSRGPYKFVQFCQRGTCHWVECWDRDGQFTALRVSKGRWKRIDPAMVPAPYTITGKKRPPKVKKRRHSQRIDDSVGGSYSCTATASTPHGGKQ